MSKPFDQLRERLLRAGIAPRHVRRYLAELADHLADLRAEEERAGRSGADAQSAALIRLGEIDDLATAMIKRRQLQSWCVRAAWAVFSLAPPFLLVAAYFIPILILWSGWHAFLPDADTPFASGRVHGLANLYFQLGKFLYFGAPILVGWGIELIAIRQRAKVAWLTMGLVLIAWMGATVQIQASRKAVPGGFGHISLDFAFVPSAGTVYDNLMHALVIFSFTVLPYLIWRLQKLRPIFS
jgi:hypothetical protein